MKTNAIVRIVLFSITILLLLAILAAGLGLRSYTSRHRVSSSTLETAIPVPIEEDTSDSGSKASVSSAQVRELGINWAAGSIVIQPADVEEIEIRESPVSNDQYAMRCRQDGSKLSVDYCEDTVLHHGFGININNDLNKDLTVLVPRDFSLEKLEVETASATLKVSGLTIREVEIDTASGESDLENCVLEKLDLDTASGDLRFTGTLDILDCDAASGSVSAVLENVPSRIDMDAASGNLDLTLPEDAGFTVKIDGMSSDFSSDFATTTQNGRHVCGDGSCQIQMDAMSGDVIIRKSTAHHGE